MKIYLFLIKLFAISALLIISNNNLALSDASKRELFFENYHSWLSETFDHAVYLSGYMIRSEWLPDAPGGGTVFERAIGLNKTKR